MVTYSSSVVPVFFKFGLGLIPLALLVLLIVGLIMLFKGLGHRGRWVLVTVTAAMALSVAALLLVIGLRSVSSYRVSTQTMGPLAPQGYPDTITEIPAPARLAEEQTQEYHTIGNALEYYTEARSQQAWTPSAEHAFEADLYPSKSSAAVTLARRLMTDSLSEVLPDGVALKRVDISGDVDGGILELVAAQASRQIRGQLGVSGTKPPAKPRVRIWPATAGTQPASPQDEEDVSGKGGFVALRITTLKDIAPKSGDTQNMKAKKPINGRIKDIAPSNGDSQTGELEVALSGAGQRVVRTASFVNEPWTEDFHQWVQRYPDKTWVRGESEQLCTNEEQAREEALVSVAQKIEERLRGHIERIGPEYGPLVAMHDPAWLRRQILDELHEGRLSTTAFNQHFSRPYGDVWRHAVLVDLSPDKLAALADRYCTHVAALRTTWARTALSSAGLVMLIFLVYLFLNAATRGYYVWSIRLAAVVIAAAGVCFVLFVVA